MVTIYIEQPVLSGRIIKGLILTLTLIFSGATFVQWGVVHHQRAIMNPEGNHTHGAVSIVKGERIFLKSIEDSRLFNVYNKQTGFIQNGVSWNEVVKYETAFTGGRICLEKNQVKYYFYEGRFWRNALTVGATDFDVAPEVDVDDIQMKYEEVENIYIQDNSTLVVETDTGAITDFVPVSYQIIDGNRAIVPSYFKLIGQTVRFEFPEGRNPTLP